MTINEYGPKSSLLGRYNVLRASKLHLSKFLRNVATVDFRYSFQASWNIVVNNVVITVLTPEVRKKIARMVSDRGGSLFPIHTRNVYK